MRLVVYADSFRPYLNRNHFFVCRTPDRSAKLASRHDLAVRARHRCGCLSATCLRRAARGIADARPQHHVHDAVAGECHLVPRKSTLYGRVTDVTSGLPLAGATLTVIDDSRERRNAGRSTTSGSDGGYALSDIMTASGFGSGGPVSVGIVVLRHTAATIAADFAGMSFSGTLADPAAIGATTHVNGSLTITRSPSGPRIRRRSRVWAPASSRASSTGRTWRSRRRR
jgi:hypothetical protein